MNRIPLKTTRTPAPPNPRAGPPRLPLAVLEARGSSGKKVKKYAERVLSVDVNVTPFGDPPESLDHDEKQVWDELKGTMPFGSLSGSDRSAFELLVRLMAEQRRNFSGFNVKKLSVLVGLIARFGMTPSDRSRIISNEVLRPSDDEFGLE